MKKITFLALLFTLSFTLKSHPNNFYLDFKNNTLEVGKYVGKNFKKQHLKTYTNPTENVIELKQILFKNGAENVLYYFHCLYGGVRIYHKNSLKKLNENNDSTTIISIVWHAEHLNYVKNWQQSIEQGEALQNLLFQLWSTPQKTNNVLCHSMGHRIFSGVVKGISQQPIQFKTVIFVGSDLDVDVFENDLKNLPKISREIIVYIHRKDRLLKVSAKRHDRKRLGLHGLEGDDLKMENLEVVDVTDSEGKPCISTTNHSYFKKDEKVLEDIQKRMKNE